jgi:hypothetical protein
MPFEEYRARIRMSRDEGDIRKWTEAESWTTHFEYDAGEERVVFRTAKEALRHALEHHAPALLEPCRETVVPGAMPPGSLSKPLFHAMQHATQDTRRHPLPFVRTLSDSLEGAGLKFFKQDRRITFVTATRPKPLKTATELSERVASLVDCIRKNRDATIALVITSLAGSEAKSENRALTPQEIELLRDLRWLVREGHVIEFSNGNLRVVGDREPRPSPPPEIHASTAHTEAASLPESENPAPAAASALDTGLGEVHE